MTIFILQGGDNVTKEIKSSVESIKTAKKKRVKENAKKILDKLKASDPKALDSLLKEYSKKR